MKTMDVKVGGFGIGGDVLTVLAGPCMAESLEICLETAEYLKGICEKAGVNYIFKASFDKANRSSGKSVRGPGMEKGLSYLAEVKKRFHVPIVTDVHETSQVAEVAEVADVLQIPAFLCRQTDLLEACGRTGRCVNVKKGQFMAPEDMKGAVEKIRMAGSSGILLTERGTSFGYHNLVVDMRSLPAMRELGVPVVFDATHSVQLPGGLGNASGGQRQYILPLARAAAAIGIDGIFMEVHPDPSKALSDGPNSLNFHDAAILLEQGKAIHGLTKAYR